MFFVGWVERERNPPTQNGSKAKALDSKIMPKAKALDSKITPKAEALDSKIIPKLKRWTPERYLC